MPNTQSSLDECGTLLLLKLSTKVRTRFSLLERRFGTKRAIFPRWVWHPLIARTHRQGANQDLIFRRNLPKWVVFNSGNRKATNRTIWRVRALQHSLPPLNQSAATRDQCASSAAVFGRSGKSGEHKGRSCCNWTIPWVLGLTAPCDTCVHNRDQDSFRGRCATMRCHTEPCASRRSPTPTDISRRSPTSSDAPRHPPTLPATSFTVLHRLLRGRFLSKTRV